MNVMFCGSREIDLSNEMKTKIKSILIYLNLQGDDIICGDANGVDKFIIDTINKRGLYDRINNTNKNNLLVVGANGKLRNKTKMGINITVPFNYTTRDDFMITNAEIVFCFWNGISKGTKRNYEKAVKLGKLAYLYTESEVISNMDEIKKQKEKLF
jgi:hypothetical protein